MNKIYDAMTILTVIKCFKTQIVGYTLQYIEIKYTIEHLSLTKAWIISQRDMITVSIYPYTLA